MLLPLLSASATASAAPSAAGTSAAFFFASTGASASAGAFAHRRDIEIEHRRRQQADIAEHREAPADAGVMIEHRHMMLAEQIAQAVASCRVWPAR